ncbi:hypothetical protein ABZ895_30340 [Streptomyces californicus]|uniref:hypothetical protein n=1 Tax=Streptomyces californicus TaxID=67351 RepID=UPI0033ECFC7A
MSNYYQEDGQDGQDGLPGIDTVVPVGRPPTLRTDCTAWKSPFVSFLDTSRAGRS